MVPHKNLRMLTRCSAFCAILLQLMTGSGQDFPSVFVAWSPDGTMIAVSSQTSITILDAETLLTLNEIEDFESQTAAPAWSADSSKIAVGNGSALEIWEYPWNSDFARLISTQPLAEGYIYGISWSPINDLIAVADSSGEVHLWDLDTETLVLSLSSHTDLVRDVEWSADGTLVATASLDWTARIWDVSTGTLMSTMTVVTSINLPSSETFESALAVSWSANNNRLAIGAADGSIRVWDRDELDGSEVYTEWGDQGVYREASAVWSVAWSPDGSQIASGRIDGIVTIRDADTGSIIETIEAGVPVGSLSWSPDGSRIAYPSANSENIGFWILPRDSALLSTSFHAAAGGCIIAAF